MRDIDLRRTLLALLTKQHEDDPSTRIVQEMGIWAGTVRIDIAVINGELQGYELKSDKDTLDRLPSQAALYNQVFDRVCLVVGQKHIAKATKIVPSWWGIISAHMVGNHVILINERLSCVNHSYDAKQLTRLLWRDEALNVLNKHSADRGVRSKTIELIQNRMLQTLEHDVLRDEVRLALKNRQAWLGQTICNES